MEYQHDQKRFVNRGLMLKASVDAVPEGYYLRLTNVESPLEGQLQGRINGLTVEKSISDAPYVHSIRFFREEVSGVERWHVGAGHKLYKASPGDSFLTEVSIPANVDPSGSGNPLAIVPYRPSLSSYGWDYIADSSRMLKVNKDDTCYQMGIAPPTVEAQVAVQAPSTKNINGGVVIDGADFAQWSGTAGDGTGATVALSQQADTIPAKMPGSAAAPGGVNTLELKVTALGDPKATIIRGSKTAVSANLSTFSDGSLSTDEDNIRFFIKVDDPSLYVEIRIKLNLDSAAFSGNYFMKIFRSSDITPVVTGDLTTGVVASDRAVAIQNVNAVAIDQSQEDANAGLPRTVSIGTFDAGLNQWNALSSKRSSWTRVGGDNSKGWANVNGIQFEVLLAETATGTPTLRFYLGDIQGAAGLDTSLVGAIPYDWRYIYYNDDSGAKSNPCPTTTVTSTVEGQILLGTTVVRQRVVLTPDWGNDPQSKFVRWYRRGGTLSKTWFFVGQQPTTSATFSDGLSDAAIESSEQLEFENDQPFTSTAPIPVSSSLAETITDAPVVKAVELANTTYIVPNMNLAIGGEVVVVMAVNHSTSEITAEWRVNHAIGEKVHTTDTKPVYGQSLPYMWGPLQGILFACGDPNRPGYLYWTNPWNPDAASAINNLEVTPPSEPLIGGFIYNQQCFCFSKQALYAIYPDVSGTRSFVWVKTPCQRGPVSPWAFTVFDAIYFVAKDGFYRCEGGIAVPIGEEELYPLFHGIDIGSGAGAYRAVDWTQSPWEYRLFSHDNEIHFMFLTVGGTRTEYVYSPIFKRWRYLYYNPPNDGTTVGYSIEGKPSKLYYGSYYGKLYSNAGSTDAGNDILCEVRPGAASQGNLRDDKFYGDLEMDLDPGGGTVSVIPMLNNEATSLSTVSISSGARQQKLIPLSYAAGPPPVEGVFARNLSLKITWSRNATSNPILFGYDIAYLLKPERSLQRVTDWSEEGHHGNKLVRGLIIECDTFNAAVPVAVEYVDETHPEASPGVATTLTLTANGRQQFPFGFAAFRAKLLRILPTDATNPWRLYNFIFLCDPEPDGVAHWETGEMSFGVRGYFTLPFGYFGLRSTTAVTLTMVLDGRTYTYTIPSTGGVRQKVYVGLSPTKEKLAKFALDSVDGVTPFYWYKEDTDIYLMPWNSQVGFQRIPLGGPQL